MSYGKMPPQAYTKETLQEAFEWWSKQPDDFRDKIQDKDDLVGYYLRVNRGRGRGETEGFTKAAKESFSSELKGLAKNLETFEDYQPRPQVKTAPKKGNVFEPSSQMDLLNVAKPSFEEEPNREHPQSLNLPQPLKPASSPQKSDALFFRLDEKSRVMVKEAKEKLNLSSEEEALRALIALGHARLKSLF